MTASPHPVYRRISDNPQPEPRDEDAPFVPYCSEEEPPELCQACHGFLVGPPGRRLCTCLDPALSPRLAEQARALKERDALAESYRLRLFHLLAPPPGDADEADVRLLWDSLLSVARSQAERGLS